MSSIPASVQDAYPPLMRQEPDRLLFSAVEVAQMCGVSAQTVHAWAKAGRLAAVRLSRRTTRFHRDDVLLLLGLPLDGVPRHREG